MSYAKLTICRRMLARQFLVRNVPLTCVWSLGFTSGRFETTNYRLGFNFTVGT